MLLKSAAAISATGNAQVNSIVGNSNGNIISGGGGKDTLTGGLGADTFVIGPANAANTVTITDFAAEDKFGITASDYGLSQGNGLVDNGSGTLVLDPTWFATVTGTQGTVAGHGQFLYNTTTRTLTWDPDGSGAVAGIALAKLQAGAVVTAGNFAISGATSIPVVGNISISDVTITEGDAGTKLATFTVSQGQRNRCLRRQLCHGRRHGDGRQRLCRAADGHGELRRRRSHQDHFGDHQRRYDRRTR